MRLFTKTSWIAIMITGGLIGFALHHYEGLSHWWVVAFLLVIFLLGLYFQTK